MIVRTPNEIQSLDDELNLFEEADWDFMSVVDDHSTNYEYFNDVRDEDFTIKHFKPAEMSAYVACVLAVIAIMSIVVMKVVHPFDNKEYLELIQMQNIGGVGTGGQAQVVDGVEASAEELIEASNLLASYINCLHSKSDYTPLDSYCMHSSQFAKKYYEATGSVITIYDTNDCYARGLREFASLYNINRINRIVKKEDIYYCYASVSYPTIYDVNEFVQMKNQSFVMKFQGGGHVSEDLVSKFLLEVLSDSVVPVSNSDVCIQMQNVGGSFKLVDDTFIFDIASDDYTVAVNQLVKSLSGLLTS